MDTCPRAEAVGTKVLAEYPLFEETFCVGEIQLDKDDVPVVVFYDNTGIPLADVTVYALPDQRSVFAERILCCTSILDVSTLAACYFDDT